MTSRQQDALKLFKQVEGFIDSVPAVLATPPFGYKEQVEALKTAVGMIDQVTADQASGLVNKTAAQRKALRQALRVGQLLPIRKVARILERTVVGMPHLVNLPKKLVSTPTLLNAAIATARDVAPYQAQFVSKGLPPDFLVSLNGAIQALQQVDAANIAAKQERTNATGQIQVAIQEGNDAVTLLDVIIRRACDADPVNGAGTLAVWNNIVPPHSKANRTASNAVSGTTADIASSAGSVSGAAAGNTAGVTAGSTAGSTVGSMAASAASVTPVAPSAATVAAAA
jgi:hypothetical protein